MTGWSLTLFGLLMLFTPSILMVMETGGEDADVVGWLMKQPLHKLFLMQAMSIGGLLFLLLGLAMESGGQG